MKLTILNHKKISSPVFKWREIRKFAKSMIKLIDEGNFVGKYKEAAAIPHCEVCDYDPKQFFVVNKMFEEFFNNKRCIVNPRILSSENPVKYEEACMSFPFRNKIKIYRYNNISINFQYPNFWGKLITCNIDLEGIPSFIVQHCIDHFNGIHIYDRIRRYRKIK